MSFIDVVILLVVVLLFGSIIFFNVRRALKAKKEGNACVGCKCCPYSKSCSKSTDTQTLEKKDTDEV